MKTKGINEQNKIDALKRIQNVGDQAYNELCLKSMLISLFAYGGIKEGTYNFNKYALPYKDKLPNAVFEEIVEEQRKYLIENYNIEYNTSYSEGVGYNSLVKK